MSELLTKILRDEVAIEEVQQWLSKNDVKTLDLGISQLDFSSFLIDFLRKHTRLLLPVPEPVPNLEPKSVDSKANIFNSVNDKQSSPVKSPDLTSPLDNRNFPSLGSPVVYSPNDRCKYTPKSPHTPSDLTRDEKRSPSIRSNTTPSPKPLQLSDFMVIKQKTPKQKAKKRIQLVSPVSENGDFSGSDNDRLDNSDVKEIKTVKGEHKPIIEKLALLYSAVISSNLVQDLLKEVNYILSLLTNDSKIDVQKYPCHCTKSKIPEILAKEICLFKCNCEGIYFACIVLQKQWNLLKYLSKSTLKILSENSSVRVYAPTLEENITNFLNESKADSQNVNILNREVFPDTVKFIIDTDSRPNYVNDESFHAFKKQRDEFYGLLNEWQESCTQQSSIEFFKAKHKRLRYIITASSAITNMVRLAELFVSQILASVFNENTENYDKLSLKGVPMSKFDLLNRRFVTPCSIVVGNEKRFPGVQEFFKDFLRSAENSFFYVHVQNALIHRITLLNNFRFSCEVSVALQKQELYLTCINKLCLLAKFLSLITFLPYQDEYGLPLDFRQPLAEMREEVQPPLDLNRYLSESMNAGRMILTIPWIVEFLNGIDNTSVLLPYYRAIFAKLRYLLYKMKLPDERLIHDDIHLVYAEEADDKEKRISTVCATEIRNLIKKRHEFNDRFVDECLHTINCSRILITLYVNSLFNNVTASTMVKSEDIYALINKPILISSEFYIGEMALYQCCPQLHDVKNLLEGGKKLSYKSVIPKMEKTFNEPENDPKTVEVFLEMHLFDNMPKSVKNSVDFVAERKASMCVKSIRQEIIPSIRNELSEEIKIYRDKRGYTEETIMDHMTAKFYASLKSNVKKELSKLYTSIEISVRALIAAEVSDESVINICIDISCRKCIEIVYNWIFNYINVEDIIKKNENIKAELARMKMTDVQLLNEKQSKKSKTDLQRSEFLEWTVKRRTCKDTVSSPVLAMHNLRNLIRVFLNIMPSGQHSSQEIISTLDDCYECIKYSADLQFVSYRRIMMLSLDLCMILVYFAPEIIDEEVLEKFGSVWSMQKVCDLKLPFEQILSYRNMEYFRAFYSRDRVAVRKAVTEYLIYTINRDYLSTNRLFSQVLRLERREWDKEILIELSNCLNDVMNRTKSGDMKITFAIQWLANFIADDFF